MFQKNAQTGCDGGSAAAHGSERAWLECAVVTEREESRSKEVPVGDEERTALELKLGGRRLPKGVD